MTLEYFVCPNCGSNVSITGHDLPPDLAKLEYDLKLQNELHMREHKIEEARKLERWLRETKQIELA